MVRGTSPLYKHALTECVGLSKGVPGSGLDEGGQDREDTLHHEDEPALQRRKLNRGLCVCRVWFSTFFPGHGPTAHGW